MTSFEILKKRNRIVFMLVMISIFEVIRILVCRDYPRTQFDSWLSSILIVLGPFAAFDYWQRTKASSADGNRDVRLPRTAVDRLEELERLKRRDMVTPEEYATKRQEILKDL